jgi:hypothetical protein
MRYVHITKHKADRGQATFLEMDDLNPLKIGEKLLIRSPDKRVTGGSVVSFGPWAATIKLYDGGRWVISPHDSGDPPQKAKTLKGAPTQIWVIRSRVEAKVNVSK